MKRVATFARRESSSAIDPCLPVPWQLNSAKKFF
jgi:hypothetical protein